MNSASSLVALGAVVALGTAQAVAAPPQEDDSVYSYGRWAVLSPAAGGGEPYVAALAPDAANNLRPEEGFSPEIIGSETLEPPPVEPPPPVQPPPVQPPPPIVTDPRDRLPTDPRDRLPPR